MATIASQNGTTQAAPIAVVTRFLEAAEAGDIATCESLLADDAVWINVSLPKVRGKRRIVGLSRFMFERCGIRFKVHVHHVAADGDVVLTDRCDALGIGPVEQRFWVAGRFVVRDGRIVVWRDSFDYRDMAVSLVRGVAGAVVPSLNRPWPLKGD